VKKKRELPYNKYSLAYLHTYISSWIFEKVALENLAIFTGTTLKARFYDSNQP